MKLNDLNRADGNVSRIKFFLSLYFFYFFSCALPLNFRSNFLRLSNIILSFPDISIVILLRVSYKESKNLKVLCFQGVQKETIGGSCIKYVHKIFRKTNISNPLIRTRTCAYQGVRNISFSENFPYVLNG